MNFFKKIMPLTLGLFLIAGTVFAQGQGQGQQVTSDDVSDKELKNFVATASEVQQIQRETQSELQQMVKEKENMDFRRFQMIMMSKQNPKMADSVKISDAEQKAFNELQPKVQKMNKQMLQDFQQTIKENGLTQQRFQAIAQAMQSDKELQQRFQKMQAKQQTDGSEG